MREGRGWRMEEVFLLEYWLDEEDWLVRPIDFLSERNTIRTQEMLLYIGVSIRSSFQYLTLAIYCGRCSNSKNIVKLVSKLPSVYAYRDIAP